MGGITVSDRHFPRSAPCRKQYKVESCLRRNKTCWACSLSEESQFSQRLLPSSLVSLIHATTRLTVLFWTIRIFIIFATHSAEIHFINSNQDTHQNHAGKHSFKYCGGGLIWMWRVHGRRGSGGGRVWPFENSGVGMLSAAALGGLGWR